MKRIEAYLPGTIALEEQTAKISVAVAVYNSDAYLERCIQSLRNQTYQNLEILLIDDGSTDRCSEICDQYAALDQRIRVIHKENAGLAAGRNQGIELATGSYITFMDGDDWIDETAYEVMLKAIYEFDVELVVCRYRWVYQDGTVDYSTKKAIVMDGMELLQTYIEEDDAIQIQNAAWNKLYKKEIIQDVRFPEDRWYEDILYTTKLFAQVTKSVYLDFAFYNYVCDREGSMMNTGINPRIFTDMIPSYYDKTAFLKKIGREDLAATHDYFFSKRQLLLYTKISRSKDSRKKQLCKELETMIRGYKQHYQACYNSNVANKNEKRKMDIFLFSPWLYVMVMKVNDDYLIPYKVSRMNRKKEKGLQ